MNTQTMAGPRLVRAPRGTEITCKGWQQEAAMRMLMNNLDPEVAEDPDQLIVYGGAGKAARDWNSFDAIVATLKRLGNDETLLVQSGKPVGVFQTHEWAPRVLIANANLVGDWANWDEFRRLDHLGLTMYGQMTAGSWIYIGTQGILQGTYQTFAAAGRTGRPRRTRRTGLRRRQCWPWSLADTRRRREARRGACPPASAHRGQRRPGRRRRTVGTHRTCPR